MKRIKSFRLFEDFNTIENVVQECYGILKDLDLNINIEMGKYGKEKIFISISHRWNHLFSLKESISSFDQLISYLESEGFMFLDDECSYEGTNTRLACPECEGDELESEDNENITKCIRCGHEDLSMEFHSNRWPIYFSDELSELKEIFGLELTFRKK